MISAWASSDLATGRTGADCVDIWRIHFPQPPDAVDDLASLLSAEERGRAARFVFPSDRAQYTVIHGALRMLLGSMVGQQPNAITLDASENGKPGVANMPGAPRFSLSHTKGMGLIAIAPCAEVGVDVEFERPGFPCVEIAERFFSAEESQSLKALAANIQPGAFFAAWVRKEAWLKARGGSLGALRLLNVGMGESFRGGTWLPGDHAAAGFTAIWLRDLDVAPGYAGAIALEEPANPFTPRLRCLDWRTGSRYA
jgi:4'-phosphopantetheinyl transferase